MCAEQWVRHLSSVALLAVVSWAAPMAPSFAKDATLSHLGHLMADEAAGENAPVLQVNFSLGVAFDGIAIKMEKTRLEDIQKVVGGSLHAHDAASGTVTWLCFASPAKAAVKARTVWFASSSGGSVSDGHPVTLIAAQEVDAGKSDGCAAAPSVGATPTFGIPGLGTTAAELKAHFGQLPYDRVRNVYFDSVRPLGGGSGKSVYQRLGYVVTRKGVVVGVAVTQTTN